METVTAVKAQAAQAKAGRPAGGRGRGLLAMAVGLLSAASLGFEIALTRIFSLLFQYHYAFMAVSVAILGLGLGALAARFLASHRGAAAMRQLLLRATLGLSLAFPLAALALAWLPPVGSALLHTGIALVPFVLIGLIMALVFARYAAESGRLYGADLLGAAAGIAAVLGLLAAWGAFSTAIGMGLLAAAAGLLLARLGPDPDRESAARGAPDRLPLALWGALGLAATALAYNVATGGIDLAPKRLGSAARDKTMISLLLDPVQNARIVHTDWDPFARVDVVETNEATSKFVFTDGGAGSYMIRFDGDLEQLAGMRYSLEYLPFTIGSARRTLILGAGAGRDVVFGLLAGSEQITAVEINPAMVAVTRRFADYNGSILDRPEVELVVGDARTAVERSRELFDLIYLNVVYSQAAEPGSQALAESYIFTREAFRTYLERLAPRGRLAIISHNALEGSRAAITALSALAEAGTPIPQGLDHMALYMAPSDDPTRRTTMLVIGKEPLSEDEIRALSHNVTQLELQSLFTPGEFELLFAPLRQGKSLDEFLAADPTYDLSPTDDNRPFFFKLDPGLPAPIQQALLAAGLLAAGLVFYGVAEIGGVRAGRRSLGLLAYSSLAGVGFMLIEVPLIQRLQLLLGYPMLALVTVLGTLLLSAGLGSLASQRWPTRTALRRVTGAALWIVLLAGLYWLALPNLVSRLLPLALWARVLAAAGLTALMGLAMGLPFPTALRWAGEGDRAPVALLWAINGAFSVVGSVAAVVLAMAGGFNWAVAAGALAYLCLAGMAWWMQARG